MNAIDLLEKQHNHVESVFKKKARVTTLRELIEHHVDEEEDDLFPKVTKAIPEETLLEMGKTMKARFDEVFEEGFEMAVPKGMGKASSDVSRTKDHQAQTA